MIDEQYPHAMLPQPSHDELARQRFVGTLRDVVVADLQPGHRAVYERAVRPGFVRDAGREPATRAEVRRAMERHPYHQAWSALNRTTQEMIWAAVQDTLEHEIAALNARARPRRKARGSLTLDPAVAAPRYLTAVDIHCMPGNYHTEYEEGDVYQAALFDRGAYLYGRGGNGPLHDKRGHELAAYLAARHPSLRPRRLLDMGCTVGSSTLPLCDAYPKAEVHAIDVAAPQLRYGHARAESLGRAVHFSQQNAERTTFDDASFDLVVSCILMHETSIKALRNYLRETWRLLAPGGVGAHMDFPRSEGKSPFDQFMADWSTHYNAEPFIAALADADLEGLAREAGIPADCVSVVPMATVAPGSYQHVIDIRKPD